MQGLIVDLFAGGGGASEGIKMALGRDPDIAINHDPEAVAVHKANHPGTEHFCQDVWDVSPRWATKGRPVALLHASPDCKHFSKAKGGALKRDSKVRDLAWVVEKWAREVRPQVITLENVEEFRTWGPLDAEGRAVKAAKGQTFRAWCRRLRALGYALRFWELRACDYGAPTIRKRLYMVARCDGLPIKKPEPTHGPDRAQPYRTAADCIDWCLPCPSIFLTPEEVKAQGLKCKRPLVDATLRRIAKGVVRYVIEAADPFLVVCNHSGGHFRGQAVQDPLCTITATRDAHGLVVPDLQPAGPFVAGCGGRMAQSRPRGADEQFQTVTAKADSCLVLPSIVGIDQQSASNGVWPAEAPLGTITTKARHAVVAPTLVQTGYGERLGQSPRVPGLDKPLGTVVAGGCKHALVSAFLAKHYTGVVGADLRDPVPTVTTVDHNSLAAVHLQRDFGQSVGGKADAPLGTVTAGGGGKSALVASSLMKLRGTCQDGQDLRVPMPTVTAGGNHVAEVRAFLTKYYGEGTGAALGEPAPTATTRDRFGLVTVEIGGEPYVIVDIGMRMLTPRELARAQGFPDYYEIGDGLGYPKSTQVRLIGNSVCPDVLAAIMRANAPAELTDAAPWRDLPLLDAAGGEVGVWPAEVPA